MSNFQPLSDAVYQSKYQLTDKKGNIIDVDRHATFRRVAKALKKKKKNAEYWEEEFYKVMCMGAIPAGRITSNAGANEHKPNTSLINCVLSGIIQDSVDGIGQAVKESLITLSTGAGIGYCFSTLRPKGAYVSGVGAKTSGPLPFADIFDKGCFTIASAGGRRGAQMATFDVRHPDVVDFIKAKREDGRFRQFNISVLLPNIFFNDEKSWTFRFPLRKNDLNVNDAEQIWDFWHVEDDQYVYNEQGQTLFKTYGMLDKTELLELILKSNYDYAEPGVIFIDRLNSENNLWFCEYLNATNPCVAEGTLVYTKKGLRPVETVEVGDLIVTVTNEFLPVVKIEVHDQIEVFELVFETGAKITVTADHIFHVQDGDNWKFETRLKDLVFERDLVRMVDANGDSIGIKIVSVQSKGKQKVYDLYESVTDSWVTEYGLVSRGCGEQPLPPYGACLLGSVDLSRFVEKPFVMGEHNTSESYFDWDRFVYVVRVFTRMLDNVVELSNLPLPEQQDEIFNKRRHGMGFFGLGTALTMLGLKYNSTQALYFAETMARTMAVEGFKVGVELAKEKGPAPIFEHQFYVSPTTLYINPEAKDFIGQVRSAKELFLQSQYMKRLCEAAPELAEDILQYGCRFTHHTSVAPTGTISLAMGDNASGGVEPSFAHRYYRNVTQEGKKTRQQEAVYSKEFLVYKDLYPNQSDEKLLTNLPEYFVTADFLHWKDHINMVAAIQPWIDSSCSKTINVPTDIPFEEFKDVYLYAYNKGCKAVSTYRYNPETLGAILSRSDDLEKSRYEFTLDDGTVVVCKGNDIITYDGETTTAENLFSALKEKTYGKF